MRLIIIGLAALALSGCGDGGDSSEPSGAETALNPQGRCREEGPAHSDRFAGSPGGRVGVDARGSSAKRIDDPRANKITEGSRSSSGGCRRVHLLVLGAGALQA